MFDEASAKSILLAAHAAWSRGDIEAILACYVDELTYWCNAGGPDGGPFQIEGKQQFRAFLQSMQEAEGRLTMDYFRLVDGIGRARVKCVVRHKRTGHKLVGSYRQVISYRDNKILRLEEYHDAARWAAFWKMIAGEASDEP
jgi:ketosteroid isomerase-like protein